LYCLRHFIDNGELETSGENIISEILKRMTSKDETKSIKFNSLSSDLQRGLYDLATDTGANIQNWPKEFGKFIFDKSEGELIELFKGNNFTWIQANYPHIARRLLLKIGKRANLKRGNLIDPKLLLRGLESSEVMPYISQLSRYGFKYGFNLNKWAPIVCQLVPESQLFDVFKLFYPGSLINDFAERASISDLKKMIVYTDQKRINRYDWQHSDFDAKKKEFIEIARKKMRKAKKSQVQKAREISKRKERRRRIASLLAE
jgi:hypothetical protein